MFQHPHYKIGPIATAVVRRRIEREEMKIAFDITLMRPACALLQAAYRCDYALADLFPTEIWLPSPTPDLRVYNMERSQLPLLLEKTLKFHAKEAISGRSRSCLTA